MRPVLSTRIFGGGLPTASQLEMVRHEYFLDLELWTDPLMFRPAHEDRDFARETLARGVSVPCVHLPTRAPFGDVNMSDSMATTRRQAEGVWRRCLDLAEELGATTLVAHAGLPLTRELSRFAEEANARRLTIAFETSVGPGTSLGEILRLVRELPSLGAEHGVCIDLAREPLGGNELRALGNYLKWVEVSAREGNRLHLPPDRATEELTDVFRSISSLPYVAFEVVTATSPNYAPGRAELTNLLERINAWFRDYGRVRHPEGVWPRG